MATGLLCNRTWSHDRHGFLAMCDITLRCWDVAPAQCPRMDGCRLISIACQLQIMTWQSDGMWWRNDLFFDITRSAAWSFWFNWGSLDVWWSLRMRHCLSSMANSHRYCIHVHTSYTHVYNVMLCVLVVRLKPCVQKCVCVWLCVRGNMYWNQIAYDILWYIMIYYDTYWYIYKIICR